MGSAGAPGASPLGTADAGTTVNGNNAADVGQLLPMLKALKTNTALAPAQALADAG